MNYYRRKIDRAVIKMKTESYNRLPKSMKADFEPYHKPVEELPEVLKVRKAQKSLDNGESMKAASEASGIEYNELRAMIKDGRLWKSK